MKVLCVERDIFQLGKMKREVGKIAPGASVLTCRDPDRAAALAKAEGCDVLLTGIDMGGGKYEGIDLTERKELFTDRYEPKAERIYVGVKDR